MLITYQEMFLERGTVYVVGWGLASKVNFWKWKGEEAFDGNIEKFYYFKKK